MLGLEEKIKQTAIHFGFSKVGFARLEKKSPGSKKFRQWLERDYHGEMAYLERGEEKRRDPSLVLQEAKSLIALAYDYQGVKGDEVSPFISRYAWGEDYHQTVGDRVQAFEERVRELFPGARFKSYVDTGPVMEKYWASLAGLGWVGKHTNLIDEKQGSYFFLASLLTTLDLEPDLPVKDRCGRCSRCIDVCPTRAIVAPYVLDARLCISYLTIELKGSIPLELRKGIGAHVFGCDDCQEVCPWNRRARLPEEFLRHPSLDELHGYLQMDEEAFRRHFQNTSILRTKRRGFLRNVCVVLGNLGRLESVPFLEIALHDPEPLVREHADWALKQLSSLP